MVLCVLTIISLLAIWVFFPILFTQLEGLVKLLPGFKSYLEEILFPKIQNIISDLTGQKTIKIIHLYDILPINIERVTDTLLSRIGASTRFLASILIMVVLTPFFLIS